MIDSPRPTLVAGSSGVKARGRSRARLAALLLVLVCAPVERTEAQGETISIGGAEVTAESIVFVIDRTTTMVYFQALTLAKTLMAEAVEQLGPTQQFDVVAFGDYSSLAFPALREVTTESKWDARWFIASLTWSQTDVCAPAVIAALDLLAGAPNPAVVLITDEAFADPVQTDVQTAIAAANVNAIPIHTLRLPMVTQPIAIENMQEISAASGGTYFDLGALEADTPFIRGDANGDGIVDLGDAVTILRVGFGLSESPGCLRAHDVNGDDAIDVLPEAVALIALLFLPDSLTPPTPYPECGARPPLPSLVPSTLPCEVTACP